MSKRELLATALWRSGLLRILERKRSQPGVLIFNHHRIGRASDSRYDRGVFSATEEQLEQQIRYVAKHFPVVGGEELEAIVTGRRKLDRMYAAVTFDDGYLDNYTKAFPILQACGVPGIFFLISDYVGTAHVPWWDEIAYLLRSTKAQELELRLPESLILQLADNRELAIRRVLGEYKQASQETALLLMEQLRVAVDCALPKPTRRFLDWDEAREMRDAGMTIGSHTQSHRILSSLSEETQRCELEVSKRAIEKRLGSAVAAIAYPVGTENTFDGITERLAEAAGYSMAFSFYGGVNRAKTMSSTNLLRTGVDPDFGLFRSELQMRAHFGRLPY